jgi:lipoyl(octanoyl) transferase
LTKSIFNMVQENCDKKYPPAKWRFLKNAPASGTWNMAVDEAILEKARVGEVLPTLRLYAWKPPCLSLGYAQSIHDVDLDLLAVKGWDIVRRPTGGKAILHTDELTYSVIGPQSEPRLAGSVIESYRCLSSALLEALHLVNLPARAQSEVHTTSENTNGPVCFEVPSNYEIIVDGKKLIGSAQARKKGGVLQHGSLPLFGDLRRITEVLVFPEEEARITAGERLLARATTVESVLNNQLSWENTAQAFARAFTEILNLDLIEDDLTTSEKERAEELVVTKYANHEWTDRV